MRVRVRLLVVLLVAALAVAFVPPVRVLGQTALLIPSLLDAPVRPLELVSREPTLETLAYREPETGDLADLWLPAAAGREPVAGVLLVFGVNNVGRSHPAVRRVAAAIARTGTAVLVPDAAALLAGRLVPAEIDGVVRAFLALRERPEVDPGRVGIVGFSAGGSLALLAAADPRIADEVAWVNAFGAFADTSEYVANLAAHAYELDGRIVPWTPTRLALEGFPRLVLAELSDGADRTLLEATLVSRLAAGEHVPRDPALEAQLGSEARRFYRLLTATSLPDARAAVAALPSRSRQLLAALSPLRHLEGVRAPVHLMHERDDHHVPFVESRKLAEALSGPQLVRHTEFRLFTHVQPDDIDPIAAAPEVWKLLWHVHALLLESA